MVKKGFLSSNIFYATVVHSDEVFTEYEMALEEVVYQSITLLREGRLKELLDGPVCQTEFGRLN
jgi:hypothetical protein